MLTQPKKKGLAKNFEAIIQWESGEKTSLNLSENINTGNPEKITYLPQRYFEELTNEQDSLAFQYTLEDVVFGYLPDHERLGFNSFQELISDKKRFIEKKLSSLREDLGLINREIVALELKSEPSYRASIISQRDEIEKQITDQEKQIETYKEKGLPQLTVS